jgi:hypothetical protein
VIGRDHCGQIASSLADGLLGAGHEFFEVAQLVVTATDQQLPVAANPQGGAALAHGVYDSLAGLVE